MARYTDAVCRLCRRENQKLFLKGERCYSGKCSVQKRAFPPGQHGQGRKKTSEYGTQFREKQKAKRYYGIMESQMLKYFEMAAKRPGMSGENLLSLLERRLDNVVYRMGFAMSRPEARQLVRHAHFTVNGKKVNIPSYLVSAGDIISVKNKSRSTEKMKTVLETNASRPCPRWLEADRENGQGKVLAMPERGDVDLLVEEHLIVEFYSK